MGHARWALLADDRNEFPTRARRTTAHEKHRRPNPRSVSPVAGASGRMQNVDFDALGEGIGVGLALGVCVGEAVGQPVGAAANFSLLPPGS